MHSKTTQAKKKVFKNFKNIADLKIKTKKVLIKNRTKCRRQNLFAR